jgi:hypothetical protein
MNLSLYHNFLDIYIIPDGLNPMEVNEPMDMGSSWVGYSRFWEEGRPICDPSEK